METAAHDIFLKLIEKAPVKPSSLLFFVIDGDDINCSTLPTGAAVVCTRGVFDQLVAAGDRGRDQLAFLLAHELAHVTIADHRKRFGKSDKLKKDVITAGVGASLIGLAVFSDWKKQGNSWQMQANNKSRNIFFAALGTGLNLSEFANGLVAPSWAKEDEEEADAFAMILMQRAGFDIHQGPQFLSSIDRILRKNKMRTTAAGAILKGAGTNGLFQGLISGGDKTSILIGALGGAFSGWAQEGTKAHYHRQPNKRAETIADFVKDKDAATRLASGKDEAAELFAETPPEPAPVAVAEAELPAKGKGKGSKRGRPRPPKAVAPIAEIPLNSWQRFLAEPGPIAQTILANHVRDLLGHTTVQDEDGPQGDAAAQEAASLCRAKVMIPKLALACGMAFARVGYDKEADMLLAQGLSDPAADCDTYRNVAFAQAGMGQIDAALRTTSNGLARWPEGELYPTEMTIRAGDGDMAGAQQTAQTCQVKAIQEYKKACANGLAAMQAQAAPT
nr:M48 family metalloprotease [Sphingomonas sp. R-74633]